MKKLLITKVATVIIGAMLLLHYPLFAKYEDSRILDDKPLFPAIESKTIFKIYDARDNLIYESTLDREQQPKAKLINYLNRSDLLIEYHHQKIYRLKN